MSLAARVAPSSSGLGVPTRERSVHGDLREMCLGWLHPSCGKRGDRCLSRASRADAGRAMPEVSERAHQSTRAGISRLSSLLLRSEEHTSELQSRSDLVCRLLLEKKK